MEDAGRKKVANAPSGAAKPPTGAFVQAARLVLASASPRRSELLASAGLEFEVRPAEGPEPDPEPGEAPGDFAVRVARAKALEVARDHPGDVVLAADTVVALGGEALGKPRDAAHAVDMLADLAGRTHEVFTGCCLIRPGPEPTVREFAVGTEVDMGDWGRAALEAYVATGEPMDKAGAYAIQGQGGFLVREIRGSYSNVVGLPLARVLEALTEWGAVVPRGA